jgi:hypothetical protein
VRQALSGPAAPQSECRTGRWAGNPGGPNCLLCWSGSRYTGCTDIPLAPLLISIRAHEPITETMFSTAFPFSSQHAQYSLPFKAATCLPHNAHVLLDRCFVLYLICEWEAGRISALATQQQHFTWNYRKFTPNYRQFTPNYQGEPASQCMGTTCSSPCQFTPQCHRQVSAPCSMETE